MLEAAKDDPAVYRPTARGFPGLLLILLLATGCDDATGPGETLVYFPLTVGSEWTYAPPRPEFGESFDWTVTGRSGDTVIVDRPEYGSHPGPVTLLNGVTTVKISMNGADFATHYRFTPGASWIRRDPWECDDGSEWVAVEETEPVETPAGTFTNTLRLERRSEANCADAGTMVEWWAPGVGLVAWDELNYYAGGPLRWSLTSYSRPQSLADRR